MGIGLGAAVKIESEAQPAGDHQSRRL
jgi:hypothetical protein